MPVPAIGILTLPYVFSIQVRDSVGASADADSVPTYAIYEGETSTALSTGSMAKLGTLTGFYTESVTLAVATGYETQVNYHVRISWTYNSKNYDKVYSFIVLGEQTLAESGGGSYPVSLVDMKLHLKVESDVSADNNLITTLIGAASVNCEEFQHRSYVTQTRVLYYDEFPREFIVPYPPLISVTSIYYIDTDGSSQLLAQDQYREDTGSEPGRITEAWNVSWPSTRAITNAVTLTYSAGYGAAASVPNPVKAAIKLLVGHWYEHRESVSDIPVSVLPQAVERLLWPERRDII